MPYSIEYFHPKVLAEIEAWPADIVADYARIAELLMEHGPNLGLPHSRTLGDALFELRPRGKSGIERAFIAFSLAVVHWYCTLLSRNHSKRQIEN